MTDASAGPSTSPPTCSPASTTWASPCPTSTRRSRCTARSSAWRSRTRRPTRSRASARRWSPSGDVRGSCIQLLAPLERELDDREVPRPLGPGPAAAGLPGHRRRAGLRDPARARPAAAVRRPEARHRRLAGSTSSTPRTPAACSSSWSNPPRDSPLREAPHPRDSGRYRRVISRQPAPDQGAETRAADPRRHPRRRHHREDFANLELPESYRAADGPQGRGRHVRGPGQQGQGPPQVAARRRRRPARARPGRGDRRGDGQRHQLQHRVDLDLRAGVDVRVPGALRQDLPAGQAPRPALPRRRLRPRRRRAQDRPGRALLEARRRGRRALPLGGAGEPRRPQRHDDGPRAAHLGLRDQLRRAGPPRAGEVQPADAQARPPDLGGGRLPRPGELHRLPPAGQPQRRRHEAGRQRADLGRQRRPRRLRDAVRPQRRRHPGLRGLQRGEGRDLPARWAPS